MRRGSATAVGVAGLAALLALGSSVPAFATDATLAPQSLIVSEIQLDTANNAAGQDAYEFVEVANTTDAEIDLTAAGVSLDYFAGTDADYAGSGDTALVLTGSHTVPAHGTLVIAFSYAGKSEAEFLAHYGVGSLNYASTASKSALANSGSLGFRIMQGGTELSRSFVSSGQTANELSANYGPAVAGSLSVPISAATALATPGFVTPAQLGRSASDPTTVAAPAVFVSEINPDNADSARGDQDNFEFFELTNTTDTAIDLTAAGLTSAYWQANNTETSETTPLVIPANTVIPAHGSLPFWLQYGTGDGTTGVNTSLFTDADFRAHYGLAADAPVVHVSGQSGLANSGGRAIQLRRSDGTIAAMSYYAVGNVGKDLSAAYAVPTEPGTFQAPLWASQQTPTPGVANPVTTNAARQAVEPSPSPSPTQVASPSPEPTQVASPSPEPTLVASPSPEPTQVASPSPEASPVDPSPTQATSPSPEPTVAPTQPSTVTPPLQITELAPNTANVSGADGYEFVEVYNSTDAAINFADYTLAYLYPNADYTNSQVALWPAEPASPVIQPGGTLVFWIKNGSNDALTAVDFNSYYGTSLVAGQNLLEIHSGGMSNSGARGVQVQTNTGIVVDRAYYNMAVLTGGTAEAAAVAGFTFGFDPNGGTMQTPLGAAAFSPGTVQPAQVPSGLATQPTDGFAPVVTDLTGSGDLAANAGDLALGISVSDDRSAHGDGLGQIKTVSVSTISNTDAQPTRANLTAAAPGRYLTKIQRVDLTGKAWLDYTFTVSDGTHTTTLGPTRITLAGQNSDPVRLNLTDQQYVSGDLRVAGTATAGTQGLSIATDGAAMSDTVPALEAAPVLAVDVTATDVFFQNGIVLGSGHALPVSGDTPPANVLTIFEDGTYSDTATITANVPVTAVEKGKTLTLSVVAGTKAWPRPDAAENNDDFKFSNARLVLPDGRTLRPSGCATALEPAAVAGSAPSTVACPTASALVSMGDSTSTPVYYDLSFTVPDDAFNSVAQTWHTGSEADGPHTVTAVAPSGSVTRGVIVDNTAPQISTDLASGTLMRGDFTIDATATDPAAGSVAGSGVKAITATLDRRAITLPLAASALTMAAGDHTVVFTAVDQQGNTATKTVTFSTVDEHPAITAVTPADGDAVAGPDVPLRATATGADADQLQVAFKQGYHLTTADSAVSAAAGTVDDTATTDRGAAEPLSAEQLAQVATTDGLDASISSATQFPYQLFTVAVPQAAGSDSLVRLSWQGSANAQARVVMSVLNTAANSWEQVDQHLTTGGNPTTFSLGALVPSANHLNADGKVMVLIQHSAGFTNSHQSTRASAVTNYNADATARSAYDFTMAWETDTQYYNANDELRTSGKDFYRHQLAVNRFLLAQRDNLNLQYVIHTGDIVDKSDPAAWTAGAATDPVDDPDGHTGAATCPGSGCVGMNQWANASAAYQLFDDAKLPYSLLAGNHDVGHIAEDYSQVNAAFPVSRYSGNPWFGGAYVDAKGQFRGQYDLISADGVDLLVLAMGWGAGQPEYDWMNQVIAKYPERKVIIDLHENLQTTGGRGPIPTAIFNQVVKPNPNVIMVLSGHYHDAYTRTDDIDDNGDGTPDRTVYSMLFDYQGLPEGGQGYLRLLHFDNTGGADGLGQIVVRTYSPSLDDFDSSDASLAGRSQEFAIPYSAFGLAAPEKQLSTDGFSADILTNAVIGSSAQVTSGDPAQATWSGLSDGSHSWYLEAKNAHGGITYSPVHSFTSLAPSGPANFEAAPNPLIGGDPRVGSTLTAQPGNWSPITTGIQFTYQWLADGVEIAGATSNTVLVGPQQVGKKISVQVSGAQDGYATVTRTSAATASVAPGVITHGAASISGAARVGATLTASTSGWRPAQVALHYQWYVNGAAISGATRPALVVPPSVVGKRVSVKITGSATGYVSASSTSPSSAVVAPGQLRLAVSVTGTSRVGAVLSARVATSPAGAALSYRWYANGRAIAKATHARLRLTTRQLGAVISVRVVAAKPGYAGSVKTVKRGHRVTRR